MNTELVENQKELSKKMQQVENSSRKAHEAFDKLKSQSMESDRISDLKKNINDILGCIQEMERVPQKADIDNIKESLINSLEIKMNMAKEALNSNFEKSISEFNTIVDNSINEIRLLSKSEKAEEINDLIFQNKQKKVFGEKVFYERTSLLEKFGKQPEFHAIYNIFLAFLILFGVFIVIEDYYETGKIIDFSFFIYTFGKQNDVIPSWFVLASLSYSIVFLVASVKEYKLSPFVYMPIYACIQFGLYIYGTYSTLTNQLPPASALIIMCETARMSMKTHSYFREKMLYGFGPNKYNQFIPKFAKNLGATLDSLDIPTIDVLSPQEELVRYTYFFFCPSLIYRDKYIRIARTNWNNAFAHLFNLLLTVLLTFVIFKAFAIPTFRYSSQENFTVRELTRSLFYSMLGGVIILILTFFGILHSWLNAFAEITRFADRRFYEDWWNATGFGTYYRKWNMVVHEFLFYYVYKDFIRFSLGKINKEIAGFLVFFISAVIHELIAACALGFFYPVMFFMFGGPGVIFVKLTRAEKKSYNVFFWAMMLLGNGLLLVLYSREFYARHSPNAATLERDGFWKTLCPQSWPVCKN